MIKKIKYLFAFALTILLVATSNIFAASSLSVSSGSIHVGDTVTVTATVSSVASWGMHISASGPVQFVSGAVSDAITTDNAKNGSKSISATYRATGTGTINFKLSGDTTTENGVNANITGSRSVTVTAKPVVKPPVDNGNSGNNNSGSNNNNSGGVQSNNNKAVTKSSNTYLSSLKVSQEGLSPIFNKNKTSYSLSVGPTVNELKVTATAEDSKSKVAVSGNTNLKDGDNTVYVVVTAENGAKRTYNIIVNKSADPEKANAYLENLIVENAVLSPEFEKEIFEYDCGTVAGDVERLELLAFGQNKDAKIEITGNDALVEGENIIHIKVIAVDGTTTKEYVVKVTKEAAIAEVAEENPYFDVEEQDSRIKTILKGILAAIKANALLVLLYVLAVVEFIQILYLYVKLNKKDNSEDKIKTGRDFVPNETKKIVEEKPLEIGDIVKDENSKNELKRRRGMRTKKQDEIKDLTEEKKEIEKDVYTEIDQELEELKAKLDGRLNNESINKEADDKNTEEQ